MAMKGFTLWFTGVPCSGKSTLSRRVERVLRDRGMKVEVLDGDEVRQNLSKGLGFSKEDRDTNIRRIGYVCNLLTRNDVVAIAAAVSPYRSVRNENRKLIGRYVEVYVRCPVEVTRERDVKGMYRMVAEGKMKSFTGVDDPYEEPESPEVIVETDAESIDQSVAKILYTLVALGYLPAAEVYPALSAEEEAEIRDHLAKQKYA
jgi:adenylyl-sulfate kinase